MQLLCQGCMYHADNFGNCQISARKQHQFGYGMQPQRRAKHSALELFSKHVLNYDLGMERYFEKRYVCGGSFFFWCSLLNF